ncbi:MAG: GNAT family N-acetyltransferase [Anaerolineae bacterium]|nr:GNAT family N-acetyltransferase [Anaerolineae bacterium]
MENENQFGLPQDLGDGLTLRWAVPEDTEALADFNVRIHSDNPDEPDSWLAHWVRDLMNGRHPTTKPSDFTVVVDENAGGKIVSSLNLISQRWAYDGIEFPVGRPELVGTDPDYRRRGLVRLQMEAVHAKSAARGEMVQAITGIPWYYRQFGYEMTIDLGGQRQYALKHTPEGKKVEEESYRLRPATAADIPFMQPLYEAQQARSLISRVRDEALWHYEMAEAHRDSPYGRHFYVVDASTSSGTASTGSEQPVSQQPVAYVEFKKFRQIFTVHELSVIPGHSWRAVGLFLLRHFQREADRLRATLPKPMEAVIFNLGEGHLLCEALLRELSKTRAPYAWYIRVPDLPGFMHHIAPVLEARLADSVMAGHSGTTKLNFYTSTMTLVFVEGKLTEIGTYMPERLEQGDAVFPDLTFLQLLFGYRSFAELDYARADCYGNEETAVLLPILFPKKYSDVTPLG